jgi:hypothetical protein
MCWTACKSAAELPCQPPKIAFQTRTLLAAVEMNGMSKETRRVLWEAYETAVILFAVIEFYVLLVISYHNPD